MVWPRNQILFRPVVSTGRVLIEQGGYRAFPADGLDQFNRNVVGEIEIVALFRDGKPAELD